MKKMKKWNCFLALMLMGLLIFPVPVFAQDTAAETVVLTYYKKDKYVKPSMYTQKKHTFSLNDYSKGLVPYSNLNLTFADPSVICEKALKDGSDSTVYSVKKTGKTTAFASSNGKNYQVNIDVVKYKNAVSSIKIGNKKLSSKQFASKSVIQTSIKDEKRKKIRVKLKPGWTSSGLFYGEMSWSNGPCWIGYIERNNLTMIRGSWIEFDAKNQSTGQSCNYRIYFK